MELVAEDFDLDLLYEDQAVLVVNKPAGMVVHPDDNGNHMSGTVVNKVLSLIDEANFPKMRPGIVHRLDKDTSGALVIAKNFQTYEYLAEQFRKREVEKTYQALVQGILSHKEGRIEAPIARHPKHRKRMALRPDGREAMSIYHVKEEYSFDRTGRCSFVDVEIKTGRTHQIRVHLMGIGHSVVGDKVYGNKGINKYFEAKFDLERQFLHANKLKFRSLDNEKEVLVESPLPENLKNILDQLEIC